MDDYLYYQTGNLILKKLFDIKPSSFNPKPKVESSLLFSEKEKISLLGEPKI